MAKKIYVTVESEKPHKTLHTVLETLDGEDGVTYAEGRIGWSGSTEKRRYELEKQFTGVQPEDFQSTAPQTEPKDSERRRRRRRR